MRTARIISTGRYVPDNEVTNDALRKRFGEVVDKFQNATGILTRFYAPESWAASDIALPAARQALARAGLAPSDVDLVVVGTDTPDYVTPATSVVLQHKLGAKRAGTFDVGCACASFPTGLAVASGLMATNPWMRAALVVGVYAMHKLCDEKDPTLFFYGDGAGAAVLVPSDAPGFVTSSFYADGSFAPRWGIFAGGSAEPATEDALRAGRTKVKMLERYPPEVNDDGWPRLVRDLSAHGGFALSEIDMAIFTQVRKGTIDKVMDTLGLPHEKTHTIMAKWGYTGSACVGMALDDAIEQGKVKPGALVTLVGSGVGFNQAAVAFRM